MPKTEPWVITRTEKRGFADSLYNLLMTSPETGRPMGFWKAGSDAEGNILIGIGDRMGGEFWILRVSMEEASEFEVKAIKNNPPNAIGETRRDGTPPQQ